MAKVRIDSFPVGYMVWRYYAVAINGGTEDDCQKTIQNVRKRLEAHGWETTDPVRDELWYITVWEKRA